MYTAKSKIYRLALKKILSNLKGIDVSDLTDAERKILAISEKALEGKI